MRYLLDSNICIAWLKNDARVIQRLITLGEHRVLLCAPVKAELWYGVYKSQRISQNRAGLQQLFQLLPSLPFDDPAAERFGEIRTHLNQQGTPIGPYDLQIAAIALTHELTLVTHNTREFARVPGLALEDWLL